MRAYDLTEALPAELDIAANRRAQKWSGRELVVRLLWETVGMRAFSWSPRPFWGWRRWVLRWFGARIGKKVHLHPSVRIAIPWNLDIREEAAVGDSAILYSLGLITIGARATISQYGHLCAGSHDHASAQFALTKPPIVIGADAWICADAFVGPGVSIGDRSILGARAVAVRDLPGDVIAVGNPARVVGPRK